MKKALNQLEILAASVLNSGRHKSINVSILCQDEDNADHLARNECLHHNPNKKRDSDSSLGFICPVQKQSASKDAVQCGSASAPQASAQIVSQVATGTLRISCSGMMDTQLHVPVNYYHLSNSLQWCSGCAGSRWRLIGGYEEG